MTDLLRVGSGLYSSSRTCRLQTYMLGDTKDNVGRPWAGRLSAHALGQVLTHWAQLKDRVRAVEVGAGARAVVREVLVVRRRRCRSNEEWKAARAASLSCQ